MASRDKVWITWQKACSLCSRLMYRACKDGYVAPVRYNGVWMQMGCVQGDWYVEAIAGPRYGF